MKTRFMILAIAAMLALTGCIDGDRIVGEVELEGTILCKSWEKTHESYCAQGSDYFTLDTGDGEKVLKFSENLYNYCSQNVRISANELLRTIECPEDSVSQCAVQPGQEGFVCTIYDVLEISPGIG